MIITDYFRPNRDLTWDYALQCGVTHGVVRLPETPDFDPANRSHWRTVVERFRAAGIRIANHPDDPPLPRLGPVARILRSAAAFERAWALAPSPCLGATGRLFAIGYLKGLMEKGRKAE